IKECVDKMLVILPFEKEFYKKWNFDVEYVGHPLVEVVDEFMETANANLAYRQAGQQSAINANGKEIIALLPGSRKQEILKKLPIMLEVSKQFPQYQFIVAKAPG